MSSDNELISRATFFKRRKKRRFQDIQYYKSDKVLDKCLIIKNIEANNVSDEFCI